MRRAWIGALVVLAVVGPIAICPAATEQTRAPFIREVIVGSGARVLVDQGVPAETARPRLALHRLDPPPSIDDPGVVITRRAQRRSGNRWGFDLGDITAGTYDVRLRFPRGRVVDLREPLVVEPPTLIEPGVLPIRKGRRLDIRGRYFGPRRVRVQLGERRMRLAGHRSSGHAALIIPRGMPSGDYPLTVTTAAGTVTAETAVRVGSPLFAYSRTRPKTPAVLPDLGFDGAPVFNNSAPFTARAGDSGEMRVTVGVARPRGSFTRLEFAIPDVFDADINEPVTLRAMWAVLERRLDEDAPDAPSNWWYRPDGLVVTVQAFDHRSGFFVTEFSGGLNATDEFGDPRSGASTQIREGVIAAVVRRGALAPAHTVLDVDLRGDPTAVDASLTSATSATADPRC